MHVILDSGTLLGRYELVMPIAQGGMSEVWLARAKGARGFQQLFAVKALLPAHASNPELVTMFLDEARIASKIRHPNVVGILDLGEIDGVLFLAMEWVEGETVASLLRRGPMPLRVATRVALDVCRAAHAAHELRDEDGRPYGLVHRDISPQNILLSPGGAIKLTDFGVLKASFGREIAETLPGRVKGKAAYMAPEQIVDSSKLDRRGDVFALGVVLYRLVVGEHPFRGRTDIETMTNVVRASLPAELPIECNPALVPLAQILRRALGKRPNERFATAADMAEALEALGPATAPAGPEEVIEHVRQTAGAQVRARRKLVMRTLQELDVATAEAKPASDSLRVASLVPGHSSDNLLIASLVPGHSSDNHRITSLIPGHPSDSLRLSSLAPGHASDSLRLSSLAPGHASDSLRLSSLAPGQGSDSLRVASPAPGQASDRLGLSSLVPKYSKDAGSVSAIVTNAHFQASASNGAATAPSPGPVIEIELAPPSLSEPGRLGPRRRQRWRERAKGAAFAALALLAGDAFLNLAQTRGRSGRDSATMSASTLSPDASLAGASKRGAVAGSGVLVGPTVSAPSLALKGALPPGPPPPARALPPAPPPPEGALPPAPPPPEGVLLPAPLPPRGTASARASAGAPTHTLALHGSGRSSAPALSSARARANEEREALRSRD